MALAIAVVKSGALYEIGNHRFEGVFFLYGMLPRLAMDSKHAPLVASLADELTLLVDVIRGSVDRMNVVLAGKRR